MRSESVGPKMLRVLFASDHVRVIGPFAETPSPGVFSVPCASDPRRGRQILEREASEINGACFHLFTM